MAKERNVTFPKPGGAVRDRDHTANLKLGQDPPSGAGNLGL